MYLNIGSDSIYANQEICDLFCLRFYSDEMTDKRYLEELYRWLKRRCDNYDVVDQEINREYVINSLYFEGKKRVGDSFSTWSFVNWWGLMNQGRSIERTTIWDIEDYFPLTEISFEGHTFFAPGNYKKWLETEYGMYYMNMPQQVGLFVHNKERIFHDVY